MFWVNAATFKKYGLEVPPLRWTFEEFERRGKQFVEVANRGRKRRDFFFAAQLGVEDLATMYRSLGLSKYNETMTKCTLDDPRHVRVLKLLNKWIYEDRILPTRGEMESFATMQSYAGPVLALFDSGHFAMFTMGRYALIQLREYGALDLSVSELPHGGFPNVMCGTRAAVIYKGSKHKDLAVLFLKFLTSEEYNMQIVDDADAHPPSPAFADTEQFNRPEKYPNEWGVHERFANAMRTIAIGNCFSPFVAPRSVSNLIQEHLDKFTNRRVSAEQAAKDTARTINDEIQRTLKENPKLREPYRLSVERQKQIDKMMEPWRQIDRLKSQSKPIPVTLKARARKIPLELIKNPFYRRYYLHKGWAE
jgi:multiple sugar transport system substrate-binding protein